MRLLDGLRVRLTLLVFGERPVDAGQARVLPPAAAGSGDQIGLDLFDRLIARAASQNSVEQVLGDDRRPAAVLALAGRGADPFEGRLAAMTHLFVASARTGAFSSQRGAVLPPLLLLTKQTVIGH
ncbi:hypothetical protein ABZY44_14065 [Streptomyces sp. NPDC006544]|uniref:hypothetical protein n=1 Tax=Streptomyces sp. NPDC006544 TaxID=3154583 RepID=UPI0033A9DE94